MQVRVDAATAADLAELADVAAATFPLACPPSAAAEDIDAFLLTTLSASRFGEYLADPDRVVLTATDADRVIGYTMLIRRTDTSDADADVPLSVTPRPAVELSKMYVLPDWHGSGAAGLLMRAGITWAEAGGASAVWLGVNQGNQRAQRFYRKHGFSTVGTRTFRLGANLEDDFVMVRPRFPGAPA
ncbi:MAG: GNAT family N-acetyltransferase [Mycobacterium sp.]